MYNSLYYRKRKKGKTMLIILVFTVAVFGGFLTLKNIIGKEIKEEIKSSPVGIIDENKKTAEFKNTIKFNEDTLFNITFYYDCGHKEVKETKIPLSFASKTIEQIKSENPEYEFYEFSENIIKANAIINEQCDNHYIIKLVDNNLYVFYKKYPSQIEREVKIDINELFKDEVEILKNGIEVGSKTELLEFLEDFSS